MMSNPRGQKLVMMIGKPVHLWANGQRPGKPTLSACGMDYPEHAAHDARDVDCLNWHL